MYSLLKQLKEVGFPQEGKGQLHVNVDRAMSIPGGNHTVPVGDIVYEPTTDELIEELGDTFHSLRLNTHDNKTYVAYSQHVQANTISLISALGMAGFSGDTPKEALIRLYIELHGKKD